MKNVRMLCVVFVASLALVGLASSSALALPEWGQCFKKGAGGKYTDSACQIKSTLKTPGEYEWRKGTEIANKKFTSTAGKTLLTGEYFLCSPEGRRVPSCKAGEETINEPNTVECTSETNSGETSSTNKVVNLVVKLSGCTSTLVGESCSTTGDKAGEITFNKLKGSLGYISKAKKEAGLLLEGAVKTTGFVKATCAPLTIDVGVGDEKEGTAYPPAKTGGYDGVIAPITPVNAMTKTLTQTFAYNGALENIPSKLEGKHIELLESWLANEPESSKWSKVGLQLTDTTSPAEEIEIKA